MVSGVLFCNLLLRGVLMQIFQDVKRDDVFIVVLDFDELYALKRETTHTERLITDVLKDVLESGFRLCAGTLYCKVKTVQ